MIPLRDATPFMWPQWSDVIILVIHLGDGVEEFRAEFPKGVNSSSSSSLLCLRHDNSPAATLFASLK